MISAIEKEAQAALQTSAAHNSKTTRDCDHVEVTHTSSDEDPQTIDPNTKLSLQAQELHYTDAEAKQVRRKIDLIVLPLLCGCYFFSVSRGSEYFSKQMILG